MKKILVLVAMIMMAVTVNANILFWQVKTTEDTSKNPSTFTSNVGGYTYTIAKLCYASSTDSAGTALDTKIALAGGTSDDLGTSVAASSFVNNVSSADVLAYVDATGLTADTYIWIELWNGNQFAAMSEQVKFGSLADYVSAAEFSASWTASKSGTWSATSFGAPEPTSGLLMLIGAAMLGLKRRKVA